MILVEQTTVPSEALPVAQFKDHLHLGTGFSDSTLQDGVLESYLRAAIAAIEARTGKVLIARSFLWTLTAWRDPRRQVLPLGPVTSLIELRVVDATGSATLIEPTTYRLRPDSQTPALVAAAHRLPLVPSDGTVEIVFRAGFAETWSDVPPDLGQAVFLLASHYYENRSLLGGGETMVPFGVSLLIDRYRRVRLFGEAV